MATKTDRDQAHPMDEPDSPTVPGVPSHNADTFNGKVHVEWDPDAETTPLG